MVCLVKYNSINLSTFYNLAVLYKLFLPSTMYLSSPFSYSVFFFLLPIYSISITSSTHVISSKSSTSPSSRYAAATAKSVKIVMVNEEWLTRKKLLNFFFPWAGHFFFWLAPSPLGLAQPYKAVTSCHDVMDVTSHDPRAVDHYASLVGPPAPGYVQ